MWSGRFSRSVYLLARPSKHVADILRRHPGPQDAPVCGLHQSDGNLTLELFVQSGVDLLPLCCEVDGYPFQGICRLRTH